MGFQTSSRFGIQYPDPATRTATPDVPRDIAAVVAGVEQAAMYGQGTLAARPVSTSGSPGKQGRFYMATDQTPHALYYDYGTGWDLVGFLAAGAIGTTQLADNAITNAKMADNSVGAAEIIDGSVGAAEIADGSVAFAELAAALKPSQGAAGAAEALRAIGAGAGNVVAGNDARLTDQRVPTDASVTNAKVAAGAAIAMSKIAANPLSILFQFINEFVMTANTEHNLLQLVLGPGSWRISGSVSVSNSGGAASLTGAIITVGGITVCAREVEINSSGFVEMSTVVSGNETYKIIGRTPASTLTVKAVTPGYGYGGATMLAAQQIGA